MVQSLEAPQTLIWVRTPLPIFDHDAELQRSDEEEEE